MKILVWIRNNDDIICALVTIATNFIVNDTAQAEQQSCKFLSQYHLPFRIYEEGGLRSEICKPSTYQIYFLQYYRLQNESSKPKFHV